MSMRCSFGRWRLESRKRMSIELLFMDWHPLMLRCTRLSRRGDCIDRAGWVNCRLLSICAPEGPIPLLGMYCSDSHLAPSLCLP